MLPKLRRASSLLQLRAFCSEIPLGAGKKFFPSDSASVAHASEYTASIVEINGSIELSYISGVHDENAVVSEQH